MKFVTQNKIGTITLTENVIKKFIMNYVHFLHAYKLVNLEMKQNEISRFIFILTLSTKKYDKMINDVDALVAYIKKQIEKKLQLFGSTIIVKINN